MNAVLHFQLRQDNFLRRSLMRMRAFASFCIGFTALCSLPQSTAHRGCKSNNECPPCWAKSQDRPDFGGTLEYARDPARRLVYSVPDLSRSLLEQSICVLPLPQFPVPIDPHPTPVPLTSRSRSRPIPFSLSPGASPRKPTCTRDSDIYANRGVYISAPYTYIPVNEGWAEYQHVSWR